MAKFAQYYLMYKGDAGSYDWDKRQEHLGEVFKEDSSIEFGLGEGTQRKVFKHRVYHLNANPNIIIMRFANDKDLPIEKDFEETVAKHEPSCFLIIDNREGMRSVAIQYRREAFSSTSQVSKIITENLTQVLYHDHCYSVDIIPDYYPEDLFKAWTNLQQHITALRFGTPNEEPDEIIRKVEQLKAKGKEYFDDSLMSSILQLAFEAKKAKYKQMYTISTEEKNSVLIVDKTSAIMRNLLSYSAALDMPVELITSDGASFRCYVDAESENLSKIINRDFNCTLLEYLFNSKKKNGEDVSAEDISAVEEQIVEFINGMIHESKDELKEA